MNTFFNDSSRLKTDRICVCLGINRLCVCFVCYMFRSLWLFASKTTETNRQQNLSDKNKMQVALRQSEALVYKQHVTSVRGDRCCSAGLSVLAARIYFYYSFSVLADFAHSQKSPSGGGNTEK